MQFQNIILTLTQQAAWLTLNRPEKLNALAGTMREEILAALVEAGKNEQVRAIVITGTGKGFCAGGDLNYMASLRETNNLAGLRTLLESGKQIVTQIRAIEKPVIAMINGAAAGAGLNLALACDIRIAAETAKFSQAFTKVGLHPDWGGTFFLPRLIGSAAACEMIFTGDVIDAQTALQLGLVNQVVAQEELANATQTLVEKLVARPPRAIALAKRAIYQGMEQSLVNALDYETQAQLTCFQTDDAAEGIQAFLNRREAHFTGR
jgi:2-(1,2-epoxy-1,2-dihydrophenyl)acetyl-CoA isomerase